MPKLLASTDPVAQPAAREKEQAVIRGVNQIELRLTDPDAFMPVAQALGASEADDAGLWQAPNINIRVRKAASAGALLPHEQGITHFCLQSRDPWPIHDRLAAWGVRFTAPLTTLGNGTHYAYGTMPSGPIFEIESAVFVPEDTIDAWVAHVAFATPDLRRLAGFYAGLTGRRVVGGFPVPPRPENALITGYPDPRMSVAWVPCGNIMLEFWSYAEPPTEPRSASAAESSGYARIIFEMPDLDVDMLAAAGVRELGIPGEQGHGVRYVEGIDPDGNRIGFASFAAQPAAPLSIDRLHDPWLMPRLAALRATLPPPHFRPEMQW